jgi:hypothetical protein
MKRTILLVLGALVAARSDPQGLVVMDYQSRGILDRTVLRELWDRTWQIAASFPEAATVPVDDTRKRIFDQNVLVPVRCDEACFQRIAVKLQAGRILLPSVEKSGDQLKFEFVLVDGESGQKLQDVSVWSDGRVDRALASGMTKVLAGTGSSDAAAPIPPAFWTAVGAGTIGLAGALWFGLEQNRAPSTSSTITTIPVF